MWTGVLLALLVHEAQVREQVGSAGEALVAVFALEGTLLGGHVAHLVLLELEGGAEAELALVAGVAPLVLWQVTHQLVRVEVVGRVEGLGAGRAAEARGVQVEEDVLVQFVAAQVLDVAAHHVALAGVGACEVLPELREGGELGGGGTEAAGEAHELGDRLVHRGSVFVCLLIVLQVGGVLFRRWWQLSRGLLYCRGTSTNGDTAAVHCGPS